MVRISVEVKSNLFGRFIARLGGASAAVDETAEEIRAGAERRSRRDTGRMAAGWQVRKSGKTEATVFNDVPYTVYNEYGTVKMPAQPMLTPSVDEARPRFPARVAKVITG